MNYTKEVINEIYKVAKYEIYLEHLLIYVSNKLNFLDENDDELISFCKSQKQINSEFNILLRYLLDECDDFIGFKLGSDKEYNSFDEFEEYMIEEQQDGNLDFMMFAGLALKHQDAHPPQEIPQYIKDIFECPVPPSQHAF